MRVIVIGCGRVGSELAVRLTGEGNDVVIIDKNRHAFRRLPAEWSGEEVVGYGIDRDVLEHAGVRQAAAVAAVTSGDNTNILVARIARENFEVPHVVARIYDPRRALIYQRLGIPTVATVSWTVDQVVRRLLPEEMLTSWTDPTGAVSMVEHALPDRFAGQKLAALTEPGRFAPVLVTRSGRARLATPDTVGQDGDAVLFSVDSDAFEELTKRLSGDDPG
jgi:trk system potassium uptake protein TrkA